MNAPAVKTRRARPAVTALSLGGHRNLTILIVTLLLFVAGCVFFVNSVVLTPGTDTQYRTQQEAAANPIQFNESLLKQAQAFSRNAGNTDLPAGRVNPFSR